MQSKTSKAAIRFMGYFASLSLERMGLSLRVRLDGVVFKPFSRPFLGLQQNSFGQVSCGIVPVLC
jgi:hypothetical protein